MKRTVRGVTGEGRGSGEGTNDSVFEEVPAVRGGGSGRRRRRSGGGGGIG